RPACDRARAPARRRGRSRDGGEAARAGLRGRGGTGAGRGPRLDPKDALGTWRRFEDAIWADARGEHASAAQALSALVREQPGTVAMRQALAAALRAAGRPAGAARALAELETLAPSDALAWHERSIALDGAGESAEAIGSERRAIALDPALPEPHNHLG